MMSLRGYQRVPNGVYLGASLIEFMVIVVVFALVVGYLIPKMGNQVKEAKSISLIYAGEAFKKSVQLARLQWLATAQGLEVDDIKGFGAAMIATTDKGWPSDAGKGSAASHDDMIDGEKDRCSRIWNALIQLNSNKVNSVDFKPIQSIEGKFVSVIEQQVSLFMASTPSETVCRYRLKDSSNLGYIDYNLKSGVVSIVFEGNNDK